MNVLSLFDGISCARVALERLGFTNINYWSSEIDKYAIEVSEKNYPNIERLGDITKLNFGRDKDNFICNLDIEGRPDRFIYEGIDLLIGGSPCQDLSIAKKNRQGLDGERSGLFFKYVEILNFLKPKYFILENVNSMPKQSKETISSFLGVQPVMINASLVSAQNRKRLFWVGKLDEFGTYQTVDISQPDDRGVLLKDILEQNVDEKYFINIKTLESINNWNNAQAGRIRNIEGKSCTLQSGGGGTGAKTGLYVVKTNEGLIVPEATKQGYAIACDGDSVDLSFPSSRTRRGRVGNKVKNIMTSQNIGVFTGGIVRKLTPVECERLQSLDDNYTEGISNSQRYKCLGNAFNVEVVKHIISQLFKN